MTVGGSAMDGRQAVIAACERTLQELASVTTRFDRLRVITAGNCGVVDSVGEYRDADGGLSVVASCTYWPSPTA